MIRNSTDSAVTPSDHRSFSREMYRLQRKKFLYNPIIAPQDFDGSRDFPRRGIAISAAFAERRDAPGSIFIAVEDLAAHIRYGVERYSRAVRQQQPAPDIVKFFYSSRNGAIPAAAFTIIGHKIGYLYSRAVIPLEQTV